MATIIKGNLVMDKDMEYEGDLIVEGNILGKNGKRYDLKVNGNITAGNIIARDIDAWNITASNITANDITAGDIHAGNITAGDIHAGNITAVDINALDISARDITYYAVCFAYYDIKCKSIIGTRNNARHFVLDGKIEVVK
jgi:hypothetical protein